MKIKSFLFLLLITSQVQAQNFEIFNKDYTKFNIVTENDEIEFLVLDTNLENRKPIFLWCQGSGPIPLFLDINDSIRFVGGGLNNFNYSEIINNYHLVVISMPKTPIIGLKENLNSQFHYIENKEILPAFIESDYLENYVYRAETVLTFLYKQNWVNKLNTVVAGHSQGSKIAAKLALRVNGITRLGLFSANPMGRIDENLRTARLDAQLGRISWEEADKLMNNEYEFFEMAHNPQLINENPNLKSWNSFSEIFYDDWLKLDIPIYLCYGTEDRSSDLCDLVPLFFIKEGKENLTIKRHLGLEHNFFELLPNGRPDYEKGHWPEVMKTFLNWIK